MENDGQRWSKGAKGHPWVELARLTREARSSRLRYGRASANAKNSSFAAWANAGNFIADRERFDLQTWRYLRPLYDVIPSDPQGVDIVIMKSAQGGASTLALLLSLWLALRSRCQVAYFLPTSQLARTFSTDRFIKLARENSSIHQLMGESGDPRARRVIDEGSATARRIADSIIYFTFVGGKVTTEALPLDALIFDEVQEMLLSEIEKAEERIAASPLGTILRVSTANFAGADIHYFYERSDQREFHTRCRCPDGLVLADEWDPRMGPLCIDKGSGSTPGIPSEWFFVCPRCGTIITDPQDGAYRPRNPGATRIGFHFPQLLSPRQTAASLIQKWERRISVKNFYNRVLGRPYTDPSTLPVTQAHLEAAQNGTLRWGPPVPATVDGVFMGIDQMGHENYVVIKARAGARMRLVHLEIIQSGDPWRRCGELMREYRVQTAAVEGLPNFNEAHRFARDHDGRVFVVHYGELENEILSWSDRPRDPAGVRRSDDEIRTPWTARVDQFKMMSWSLGKWAAGEVETPDARGRTQRLRTDRGEASVMVCRDVFWVHLQRVALLTEPVEGHEDERKVRSVVKKLGIDPHFAFANMLCDVAWIRRFGTEQILMTTDESLAEGSRKRPRPSPYLQQIMDAMPEKFDGGILDPDAANLTCGDCEYFDSRQGFCKFRQLLVKAGDPSCDCFDAKLGDDDEYP